MERFLIWGAGGHGRVVRDILLACGDHIVGVVDRSPPAGLSAFAETEIDLAGTRPLPGGATALSLGIGDNQARWRVFLAAGKLNWPQRVHPSAIVGSRAGLGDGTVVMPLVVINADAVVGRAVILNTGAIIEHDCTIGDGAHISPNATLCGGVRVGSLAWIGAGATIVPGISIGERALVGAGAVVTRDVPADTTVVGSPAQPVPGRP